MKKSLKNLLIFTVVLFVFSGIITFAGALAKLQHWPWAGSALIIGMGLQMGCFLTGGVAIISYIRNK